MSDFNVQPAPPLSEIVKSVEPCLVHISTPDGSGSGFVIDRRGNIITNAHVVREKGVSVKVEFVDGSEITGIVIGIDEEVDLAYVQVSAPGVRSLFSRRKFPCLSLGDSDAVSVGEDVLALGYPLGEILKGSPTVTRGIVSAKRPGQLQTDAAINPGNSGGPLVNAYGKVVGVNTSSIGRIGGDNITGINFAISINVAKGKLDFLASGGEIKKASAAEADDSADERWILHDIGKGGFSIAMPPWYTLKHFGDNSSIFHDDTSNSIFSLFMLGGGHDGTGLEECARSWWSMEKERRAKGRLGYVSPLRRGPSLSQWSYDYYENKGDGFPIRKGKGVISLTRSRTGSYHYQIAGLNTPEGSEEDRFGLEKLIDLFLSGFRKWDSYGNSRFGWSISAAPGWDIENPEDWTDTGLTLWAPDKLPAYLSVEICDLDDYEQVDELCRQYLAALLTRLEARDRFEIISSHKDDLGEHEWHRINFRYQGRASPPSFGIVQVGRVGLLEYIIAAGVSERYVPDCIADIDNMLASFRF